MAQVTDVHFVQVVNFFRVLNYVLICTLDTGVQRGDSLRRCAPVILRERQWVEVGAPGCSAENRRVLFHTDEHNGRQAVILTQRDQDKGCVFQTVFETLDVGHRHRTKHHEGVAQVSQHAQVHSQVKDRL